MYDKLAWLKYENCILLTLHTRKSILRTLLKRFRKNLIKLKNKLSYEQDCSSLLTEKEERLMRKRLLITSSLALVLGLGVAGGLSLVKKANIAIDVQASGTINTEGKTLISLKNSGWTTASAKTAVYFWNSSSNAWSSKYVADFPVYDSGNSIYIIDVPSGEWTNYKCVRVNPSSCPATPNSTCWNDGIKWNETSNFAFGTNNTLEPVIDGGYSYNTAWKFEAGTQVYLDLNGQGWTADSAHIYIHIWGNTASGAATDVELTNVHGWDNGNDHLFEVTVPGTGYWSNIILYRGPSSGSYWNQTADLSGDATNNVYKLTSYTGGSWGWNMSNEDRAECFGTYFLEKITCSGSGSITSTSTDWSAIKSEYNNMCDLAQGVVWLTEAKVSGSDLEEAMYRYDYIVLYKQYTGYDDFINRSGTSGAAFTSKTSPLAIIDKETDTTLLIVIISVLAAAGVGGYFFFRRKRHE